MILKNNVTKTNKRCDLNVILLLLVNNDLQQTYPWFLLFINLQSTKTMLQ